MVCGNDKKRPFLKLLLVLTLLAASPVGFIQALAKEPESVYQESAEHPVTWQQSNGCWFAYQDGALLTGWVKWNARWYYLGEDGALSREIEVGGDLEYSFEDDGAVETIEVNQSEMESDERREWYNASFDVPYFNEDEQAIFDSFNLWRTSESRHPYILDEELSRIAKDRLDDQVARINQDYESWKGTVETLEAYTARIGYRVNRDKQEFYMGPVEDGDEAAETYTSRFAKNKKWDIGHYKRIGIASAEYKGQFCYMVILSR